MLCVSLGLPDLSAATVRRCTRDGTEYIGSAFQSEHAKQCENQSLFIINGLRIRDDDLMFGMLLYALDEIGIVRTPSSDENFS